MQSGVVLAVKGMYQAASSQGLPETIAAKKSASGSGD